MYNFLQGSWNFLSATAKENRDRAFPMRSLLVSDEEYMQSALSNNTGWVARSLRVHLPGTFLYS